MYRKPDKTNSQLVAHCFLAKGEVHFDNYAKYYHDEEYQQAIDHIEMEADY